MKFIPVLLLLPLFSLAQIKLDKVSLLDNKVEILVPKNLKKMSQEVLNKKYPNRKNQPTLIFTNENSEVNLVVDYTQQLLTSKQLAAFKDFHMSSLKKTHADIKWLGNGIKKINGKEVGFFKFTSKAVDQQVFNYYFFTDLDGRALVFTFNCVERIRPAWEKTAEQIVGSLKTKLVP